MHLYSTLLVLLLLSWTEYGSCSVCNGKALSREKKELFDLYDKIEKAISSLLPSSAIGKVVCDIKEKIKSQLCDVPIEGKALQDFIKAANDILNKSLNKQADVYEIVAFLSKVVVDTLDNMLSTLTKKVNRI